MENPIQFTLNGRPETAPGAPGMTLLRYLRDVKGLTGTKNGCGTGHCGACTVLVDGRPARSCVMKLSRVEGRRVETIEALSGPGPQGLHPVQAAFLAAGAVQCGFCTPGLVLAAKALLDRHPEPTREQIIEGLRPNVCRCTGYVKVFDAVSLAARWIKNPGEIDLSGGGSGLGRSRPDLDGIEKVKGTTPFAGDLTRPGVLFGKILWSTHPHAEILSVDVSRARSVDGVVGVLTAADVPGHNGMGSLKPDQPVFCRDRVRFVGDAVAAVFAETEDAAEAAVKHIRVAYRELAGVFSAEAALREGAPRLHDGGNICKHLVHTVGDPDAGFGRAALIVEGRFETPFVEHAYLEPEAGLAFVEDGVVTVHAPTQFPFEQRRQLAAVLGLQEERVRVVATPLGGAFGSKLDNTVEAVLAVGAHVLKRPVKITLTREESIRLSTKRHPYVMDYRLGVDADGRITAVDASLLSDAGPYTALSPRVIDQACIFCTGPYRVPNLRVEGWAVHTNNANGSAFRGFGINQAAVAIESLIDDAARALRIDPFEIRVRNALEIGDQTVSGEILKASVAIKATLEAARQAFERERPRLDEMRAQDRKVGYGVAAGFKNVGAGKGKIDDAGAIFVLKPDGRIELRASAVDMGQGTRTAILQIAAEALRTEEDRFDLITGDTQLTIRHGGAVGERQILITGKAVEVAAGQFEAKLVEKAAEVAGLPQEGVRYENGRFLGGGGRALLGLDELAQTLAGRGERVEVSYYYVAPMTYALADEAARRTVPPEEYSNYPAYAYTTQAAVVEVDEDTGQVRVLKIIAAHDCGRAINPQKIEGQIEGSCMQGLGYALSEEYPLEGGRPLVSRYGELGVPKIDETPEIEVLLIEDPEPKGPFGAKGISEVATVPVTPAILNAIRDATGIRVRRLPADPRRMKELLRAREG